MGAGILCESGQVRSGDAIAAVNQPTAKRNLFWSVQCLGYQSHGARVPPIDRVRVLGGR